MLHACVERFDVMGGRGNILGWDVEVNKAIIILPGRRRTDSNKFGALYICVPVMMLVEKFKYCACRAGTSYS
jgi:hypothetical protein